MTMELFPNLYYYVTNYKDNPPNNIAGMVNNDRRDDHLYDHRDDNDNEKMCDEVDDDGDDDGNVDDFNSDETASHMSFFENLKLEVRQCISDIISTDPDNEDSFTNFLKTTASDISSFVFDNYKEPSNEPVLPMYLSAEDIAKHNVEGDQRRLQRLLEQQTKTEKENLSNGHYL
jgi:hypothetical protein